MVHNSCQQDINQIKRVIKWTNWTCFWPAKNILDHPGLKKKKQVRKCNPFHDKTAWSATFVYILKNKYLKYI